MQRCRDGTCVPQEAVADDEAPTGCEVRVSEDNWTCNLPRHGTTVRAPGSSCRPVCDDIGCPISTGMLSLQPVRKIGTCTGQLRPSDAGCPIRTGMLNLQPVRTSEQRLHRAAPAMLCVMMPGCPIITGNVESAQPVRNIGTVCVQGGSGYPVCRTDVRSISLSVNLKQST